jgi:hypothetical protein
LVAFPGEWPGGRVAGVLGSYAWFLGTMMIPLTMLYFPDGRLPTARWRWVGRSVWLAGVPILALAWVFGGEGLVPIESVRAVEGPVGAIGLVVVQAAAGVVFLAIPLSAVSLIHRYVLADAVVRQQLKWVAFGAVLTVLLLASDFFYTMPGYWEPFKEGLMFALLPLSTGIAILRYRLWDINVVIRKTLVYSLVTGTLAAVYYGSVLIGQRVLGGLTEGNGSIAIVLSTLLVAALFSPLRGRVQGGIDRRFFRRKYDARQVIAAFGERVRDLVELEALEQELVRVVQETVEPAEVTVWLREPADRSPAKSREEIIRQ